MTAQKNVWNSNLPSHCLDFEFDIVNVSYHRSSKCHCLQFHNLTSFFFVCQRKYHKHRLQKYWWIIDGIAVVIETTVVIIVFIDAYNRFIMCNSFYKQKLKNEMKKKKYITHGKRNLKILHNHICVCTYLICFECNTYTTPATKNWFRWIFFFFN